MSIKNQEKKRHDIKFKAKPLKKYCKPNPRCLQNY